MQAALLAGTQSGCGKTTVMLALLQYLQAQQYKIASFKTGPDFLDPLWHQAITHKPAYNLDTRMIGAETSKALLTQQASCADISLIEGVMGLFDGRSGVGGSGSSAELAKELQLPVFLVVDAKGMSGTIVPLVSGFCTYATQMGIRIAGIIANRVGSAHHADLLANALHAHNQPPLIAWLAKNAPILPERHLGLMQPSEVQLPNFLPYLQIEAPHFVDLFTQVDTSTHNTTRPSSALQDKKIAIARDAACCFLYPANLDFLQQQGAKLLFFSPIASEAIPQNADAVWLPGGYPELFAAALSQSTTWQSLHAFITAGKPVLAECGGAMLLGETLIDHQAQQWRMANILPYHSKMQTKLASLGYREEASGLKGHEFHHSVREMTQTMQACFQVNRGDNGIRFKNVRASYIHWYFASAPDIITNWFNGQ